MDQVVEDLRRWFRYFWRDTDAWVYIPVAFGEGRNVDWQPFMHRYPRGLDSIIRHTLKYAATPGANVFFSPALFSTNRATKDAVMGSWTLWVDFDGNAPKQWVLDDPKDGSLWVPPPTLRVQSSIEGHEHCYWALDTFITDIDALEDRNQALAYVTGADTSGWDADQVLRPIHTVNRKRNQPVVILDGEL